MSNPFSFGKPTTTGATGGSLFGTTSGTNTGGSIFGGGATNTQASTGFSFGSTPASTTTVEQKPLFGAAPFSFGQKSEETKTAEQPKGLFANTSQAPGTPGSAAPSLFGSTTPAAASTQKWSFGNPSTTPAGPPPQATAFGASTGTGGIFGAAQTQSSQSAQDTPKPSPFSFGKPPTTSTAPPASGASQSTTTPSLFGTAQPSTSGLFGAKPVDKPAGGEQPAASTGEPSKPTFGFGQPATATTTSTTSPSLFSAPPADTATNTSQSQQPLFGTTATTSQPPSSGLFNKPATSVTSGGSLFSKPGSTASSDTAPKPAFSFPTATTQTSNASTPAAATATSTAQKPLFGGIMGAPATSASTNAPLFGAPASTTATSTTTPAAATTSAPTGSLFSLGGTSAPASSAATTTTTASATSVGLFSLGGAATTQAASNTATTTAAQASSSTPATTGLGASTLGASTLGPAPPAQSRLRNKTLDEILTRWATDLTRYTKDFKTHAETIAQWDQIIVDNSSKIDKLYVKTRTCEKQTMSVEMQLTAVENQQNELDSWLSKYENDVDEMLAKDGASQTELGGPDQERERTYKLAEKLGERLEDIGRDLESMVEEVNAANSSLSKHSKADEPITQIVRILNSHLTQLQQIDQSTAALQAKVSAAQKSAHGMGYLNGATNGEGRAAVDDFYKSYMGRR